jgi:hypothetical protein
MTMDNVKKFIGYISYNCLSNNSDYEGYCIQRCDPRSMVDFRRFGTLLAYCTILVSIVSEK